jgi:hypothetical protein
MRGVVQAFPPTNECPNATPQDGLDALKPELIASIEKGVQFVQSA